jgi:hypothetical protein
MDITMRRGIGQDPSERSIDCKRKDVQRTGVKKFREKVCLGCGQKYQPTGPAQKFCKECGVQVGAARQEALSARWKLEHPERWKEIRDRASKKWALVHPEERKEATNRSVRKWMLTHREQKEETNRRWCELHPEMARVWRRKREAKRRTPGFVPLNEPFDGCEGHHIDEERVIYIPKELHRSIWHNAWNGFGMEQINALAVYLYGRLFVVPQNG